MEIVNSPLDFSYLEKSLTDAEELRDGVKTAVAELEKVERSCLAILSRVHVTSQPEVQALLTSLEALMPSLVTSLKGLATLVESTHFYRYHDGFARSLQNASFIVVFRHFLACGKLLTKGGVCRELQVYKAIYSFYPRKNTCIPYFPIERVGKCTQSTRGLSHVEANQTVYMKSRMAVTRVTMGDFSAPVAYSYFAKELSSAFSLLNLKNDGLRKRFDGIKYDVKKLEEVVYDLSLRGLIPRVDENSNADSRTFKRAKVDST